MGGRGEPGRERDRRTHTSTRTNERTKGQEEKDVYFIYLAVFTSLFCLNVRRQLHNKSRTCLDTMHLIKKQEQVVSSCAKSGTNEKVLFS